jgi:hypothetical protein
MIYSIFNLPERVQILGHTHIICITVREDRIICCQIFCDFLLKSAFEWIFNVMQWMCACLPQHPWLFIFSSRGHDRQSSDQNFSSQGYDRQSSEQNRKSSNLVSHAYHLHYCTGKQNYLLSNILRFALKNLLLSRFLILWSWF